MTKKIDEVFERVQKYRYLRDSDAGFGQMFVLNE